MILGLNRADLEGLLARALSRQIGYTTGAYDLDRILSVLDVFKDKPSAYKQELVSFLQAEGEDAQSDDYLAEVISFATAFGILQQTSTRESNLQRFSPTELGRALFACGQLGHDAFYRYVLRRVVFLADADAIASLLCYYAERPEESLIDYYVTFASDVRNRRFVWLCEAFPEKVLRARIEQKIAWLTGPKSRGAAPKIELPSRNTARHHATPRKGWLQALGLLNEEATALTPLGIRAWKVLTDNRIFFWLGPPRGAQEALGIQATHIAPGPFEDDFDLSDDMPPADVEQNANLAESVSKLMVSAYPFARLVHASQASMQLPLEYIRFRSERDGIAYDAEQVFDHLFRTYRDRFDRLSALRGHVGFYRVK